MTNLYFISTKGTIKIVDATALDNLTREDAIFVAMSAYLAQKSQLISDIFEGDLYIKDVKVVDGLEASLSRLDENHPYLLKSIKEKISGTVFAQC